MKGIKRNGWVDEVNDAGMGDRCAASIVVITFVIASACIITASSNVCLLSD